MEGSRKVARTEAPPWTKRLPHYQGNSGLELELSKSKMCFTDNQLGSLLTKGFCEEYIIQALRAIAKKMCDPFNTTQL